MINLALFGCGKFGSEIFSEVKRIASESDVHLKYVVTESGREINGIEPAIIRAAKTVNLKEVGLIDGAIIATPSATHSEIVIKYLEHTHLLVEKPVIVGEKQINAVKRVAKKSKFHLVPAHNFRFNPCVEKLAELLLNFDTNPVAIFGKFVNLGNPVESGLLPEHEMLHLPDIIDYLFRWEPVRVWKTRNRHLCNLNVSYAGGCDANYMLGWSGREEKSRKLRIDYERGSVSVDFETGIIECCFPSGDQVKFFVSVAPVSINRQLRNFIGVIRGQEEPRANLDDVIRINRVLAGGHEPVPSKRRASNRPRIGVIGGGVFGVSCALKLSEFAEVAILERNEDLLLGASLQNQWRHHSGFHYPLSYETALEIKKTKKLFEDEFGDSISFDATAYYCVSSRAKEIPAERYLAACNLYGLNYKITAPPDTIKPGSVSVCLETDEGLYDVSVLREMMHFKIRAAQSIDLLCGTEVIDAYIEDNRQKSIWTKSKGEERNYKFDFLVNCTYANLAKINHMIGVGNFPVRLEEVEILELKLPFDPICLTIIDGPFVSLTSMLSDGRFFLSHRDHSVLRRTALSFNDRVCNQVSNRDNIIQAANDYMIGISQDSFVKSWVTQKAISTQVRERWERPTVLFNHGFGTWSVIGGKILTAVANASELASLIEKEATF